MDPADLRPSLSRSISNLNSVHITAANAILRPFHPFFEIHLTTLRNLVSYSSPLSVLLLSRSSLLSRLASRRFNVASSGPLTLNKEEVCGLGGTKDWDRGEVLDDPDVDDNVRCLGTVNRDDEA